MADRIPSDHPSIETVRARVERHGGGKRLAVPASILPDGETGPRVILDGRTRFARLGSATDDSRWVVGLYETTRGANDPRPGQDRLGPWLDEHDQDVGTSVEVDVIEPGYRYGIREPGTRAVYSGVERPDEGLGSIARSLGEPDEPGE